MRASDPQIITFGCRLNAYESQVMRGHAAAAGLHNATIINTCAVTAEATRQSRQAVRRARRANPEGQIIVTGCAVQIDPQAYGDMPEVDAVLGNEEKLRATSFLALARGDHARVSVNDIMGVTETAGHLIDGFGDRARAFVQIQTGCDHRCTFCIIPYGRGNSRSVPMGEVVDQIRRLADEGFGEVVLTGVDITSFGADLPGTPTLGVLVQKILHLVPGLARLRISSIDSIEVDEPLLDAILGEPRLMPHLHLSLQAGDDMILKRMKRRHLRDDAIRFCADVRAARPDMVFGADLIAGFPTETEAMFDNSLSLVDDCGLTWLHVFPYSIREGTPAAKMPQVDMAIRKERAARLRALGDAKAAQYLASLQGTTQRVLVEKSGDGTATGHTEGFAPILIAATHAPGDLVAVTVTGHNDGILTGSPLDE